MKMNNSIIKSTFLLCCILMLSVFSYAQKQGKGGKGGKGGAKTAEQRAEAATKRWTNVLTLTTSQQPEVKKVFLARAQKVDAIKAKYQNSTDKTQRKQELKTVREEADASLKQILTPEQYEKYIKTKEENHKKKSQDPKAPVEEDEDDVD